MWLHLPREVSLLSKYRCSRIGVMREAQRPYAWNMFCLENMDGSDCLSVVNLLHRGGWTQESVACENEFEALHPRFTDVSDWLRSLFMKPWHTTPTHAQKHYSDMPSPALALSLLSGWRSPPYYYQNSSNSMLLIQPVIVKHKILIYYLKGYSCTIILNIRIHFSGEVFR